MHGFDGSAIQQVQAGQGTPLYRTYVLIILTIVCLLSFFDRVLAGIAVPSIREELGLSDTEIGLINGTAYSIPYLVSTLLLGWLADRHSRVRILSGALALWSACTAAFGAGHSFAIFFLTRAGLGAGEGAQPTAQLLLMDYFPRRQLARAMAIYSFGAVIGMSMGILIGAILIAHIGWRHTFFLLGFISFLMVPILLFTVREPLREAMTGAKKPLSIFRDLRAVLSNRSFLTLCLASGTGVVPLYATFFWIPSLFVRKFDVSIETFAVKLGLIQLIAGLIGAWLGGYLADRLTRYTHTGFILVAGVAYVLAAPFIGGTVMLASSDMAFICLFFATMLQCMQNGPSIAAYQSVTAPAYRGAAAAVFSISGICVGMGLGLPLIGGLSDFLKPVHGDASLEYALYTLPFFYLISGSLWLYAAMSERTGISRLFVDGDVQD